jgi:Mor family transcriptional regulator
MTTSDGPHERERKAMEAFGAELKTMLKEPLDDAAVERARLATQELAACLDAKRSDGSEYGPDNEKKVTRNALLCVDRASGMSWADLAAKYKISEARCRQIVNAAAARGN